MCTTVLFCFVVSVISPLSFIRNCGDIVPCREPEKTAEAFVDGWFHTGDLGSFDENGNLLILERVNVCSAHRELSHSLLLSLSLSFFSFLSPLHCGVDWRLVFVFFLCRDFRLCKLLLVAR